MVDLLIKNIHMMDSNAVEMMAVTNGKISARGKLLDLEADQLMDGGGSLLIPGFVDSHVHLDIGLVNDMLHPGRVNAYVSQSQMMADMEAHKAAFTKENIIQRAEQLLDMAVRHGVTAVRAQCHVDPEAGLKHLEALLEVKQRMSSRISLQIVAFPDKQLLRPETLAYMEDALRLGADVMGCAPLHDADRFAHIDAALDLAMKHDVDLDVHADLALPYTVDADDTDVVYLSRRVIERGYQGRVCAGHVSALDSLSREAAQDVIELIRQAGISVISLPDLYRLGRTDTQHVRRGLTRVKELLHAGVNVCFASNNVRDCLRPYGNMNPLEEALILSYGAHMDEVMQLEILMRMATWNGAKAIGLAAYGLQLGNRADFCLVNAPSASAAIVNQAEVSHVFKNGQLLVENQRNTIWHMPNSFPVLME
jgi:cytosine/creatinine deaminase